MVKDKLILPDIFIAGAIKCGTTSLFDWLADHPSVEGSSVKETNFLADSSWHGLFNPKNNVINGLEGFNRFYSEPNNSNLKLEGSPTNIYSETARKTIKAMEHNPKVIFLLREPSEQIFSLFRFFKNNVAQVSSGFRFSDWLESSRNAGNFRYSFYVDYLRLWKNDLNPRQIKVYLFEDLARNNQEFMKKVCFDLEIDFHFYQNYSFLKSNETYFVKNRYINSLLRRNRFFINKILSKRFKRFFKGMYMKLNTQKVDFKTREEELLLKQLKEEFQKKNTELAKEFGLDLSSWKL